MYLLREFGRLLASVSQSHCSEHVALGCDAYTCTASHTALARNLLPEFFLCALYFVAFRVALNLLLDGLDFLELKVNDVVHNALRLCNVLLEELEIKVCLGGEWVHHV